jgi:prepilin-type N-terminal cleavage/methylation domain-containing protein
MRLPSPQHSLRRRARQAGLTLIELLIVLLIVVAVAGIVVPLFPGMQRRAHASTTAANITETHKAIQLYAAMNMSQPNDWDSLISDAGTGQTLRTDRFTIIPDLSVAGLPQRIRSALTAAGITRSHQLVDGIQGNGRLDGHANRQGSTARINTFGNYYSGTEFSLTTNGSVVVLGSGLQEITRLRLPVPLNVDPLSPSGIEAYVVFGIGNRISALGSTMLEPPVHFPGEGDLDPTQAYSRFVAVYAIPTSGAAFHVRTAALHNDHLDSLGNALEDYYEVTSN